MRRARLWVPLALGAVLVGLLAFGLFPQAPLKSLIEGRASAALGGTVRIGRLKVVPVELSAELEDVSVEAPTFRLSLPKAQGVLYRSTFSGAVIAFESLHLERPVLTLLPEPAGATPRSATPRVWIDRLDIDDASVEKPASPGFSAHGLSAHGAIGSGVLSLRASGITWQEPTPAVGVAEAQLRIDIDLSAELESAHFEASGLRVEASGRLGPLVAPAPDLKLTARLQLPDALRLLPEPPADASGHLAIEARLRGTLAAPILEATTESSGLILGGWRIDSASAKGSYRTDAADLELSARALAGTLAARASLRGKALTASLDANGLVVPDIGRVSAQASARGDLERRIALTTKADLTGSRGGLAYHVVAEGAGGITGPHRVLDLAWSAQTTAEGPGLQGLDAHAEGTARGTWPPSLAGSLSGSARLDRKGEPVSVPLLGLIRSEGAGVRAELTASPGEGELKLGVQLATPPRVTAEGRGLDLALFDPRAGGLLSLELDLEDPLGQVNGSGRAELAGASWAGAALGDAQLSLAAERGRILAKAAAPQLGLTGEARRAGPRAESLDGQLTFDATPLQPLARAAGHPDLTGQLSASATFSVPTAKLAAAEVSADVRGLDVAQGRYAVRAPAPFSLRLRRQTLDVEGLRLEAHGSSLDISGQLGLEPRAPMALRARLAAELAELPLPEGVAAAGHVDADLAISGSPERPEAKGEITGGELRIESAGAPAVSVPSLKAALAGQTVMLAASTANFAGGTLTVEGRVPLAAVWVKARASQSGVATEEEASLDLHWQGLNVPELLKARSPKLGELLSASASGEARLEGGLAALAEPRGFARLSLEGVRAGEVTFQVSPLELRLQEARVASAGVTLQGGGGMLTFSGSADLVRRHLELLGKGRLDLRAVSPFLPDSSLSGAVDMDVKLSGPFAAPEGRGRVDLHDVGVRNRAFPHALTGLSGAVVFEGESARLEGVSGSLAGGTLTATGGARLGAAGGGPQLDARLEGRGLSLRYPEGLRTRVDLDLALSGTPGALKVAGEVRAERGLYDLDAALRQSLKATPLTKTTSPFLRGIALDVRAVTLNPVLVRHDLVRLEASGTLSVRGDMETPAPFGRVEVLPGGTLDLQGHEFSIESGTLTYSGDWNPSVALRMLATVRNVDEQRDYSVTLTAAGHLENPQLTFSSEPGEPEREILSLLATGSFGNSVGDSVSSLAENQLAILMTSRLTGGLARGLGLDRVSFQPELLSRETDPGARFTFEKQLTDRLRLIQSYSLNDAEARFTEVELSAPREVRITGQRDDDGSLTAGLGQTLRFGGPKQPRTSSVEKGVRIAEVRLEGAPPGAEASLRGTLKVKQGKRATASRVQDDVDRLHRALVALGFIEAEVSGSLEEASARFVVRPGPRFTTRIEGMASPPELSKVLKGALYEDEALEQGRALLLRNLNRDGYLRASVATEVEAQGEDRVLRFRVEPGPRSSSVSLTFPGAKRLSTKSLSKASGGPAAFLLEPEAALDRIRTAYGAAFYLTAEFGPVSVSEAGGSVQIVVPIREGAPAQVASLRIEGGTLSAEEAQKLAKLAAGQPYDEKEVVAAATRLRDQYLSLGYPAVRVAPEVKLTEPDIDVILRVETGDRLVLGSVEIQGAKRTRLSLIRKRLKRLTPGRPLDVRALVLAERRLMELGVFTRVSITYTRESPSRVTVDVTEEAPLITTYQVRYNDDDGAGGDVDAELGNLFGRGLALGGRYRKGADIEDERASLQLPAFLYGDLIASVFRTSEDTLLDEADPELGSQNSLQRGFQIQHKINLPRDLDLLLGYRFRRYTQTSPFLLEPITVSVASLDASLLRDTRDFVLDARKGSFMSVNLEYSPEAIGSELQFFKSFGQAFLYKPLGPSWLWAHAYRLGLAWPFAGQELVPDERFQAGGANSVRGYPTESLGPRDIFGEPAGGNATFVMNQELRYRHRSGLGGALFWDAGNVFETVSAMSFDLKHSLGVGLRWSSPIGLLRFDLARGLQPEPGTSEWGYYFSLGQSF